MVDDHQQLQPDIAQARRSFDRAAKSYDLHAVLQQEVQRRTLQRLNPIRISPDRVLDLGCGTGDGLIELARQFKGSQVVGGDLAEQMLRQALRKQRWWKKRRLVAMDAHHLPFADGSFDLLYSSLVLQWSVNLDQVLAECRRVLRPGGLMVFSSLGPLTLYELRKASAQVDGSSRVNAFFDMHDVGDAMVRAGFEAPVLDVEQIVMTYPDLKALARDLKAIGAHNVTQGRQRGMTSARQWQRFEQAYEKFRRDGRLPATYEVFYAHGWVREAGESGLPAGPTEIPIQWHGRN
jgi:malonyl-CoA O-methyltransferase